MLSDFHTHIGLEKISRPIHHSPDQTYQQGDGGCEFVQPGSSVVQLFNLKCASVRGEGMRKLSIE
jgi:hypothetical protein